MHIGSQHEPAAAFTSEAGFPFAAISDDGERVALGGSGGDLVEVWDLSTLESPLFSLVGRHSNVILGLDFSAEGSRLAAASLDGKVAVWGMDEGRLLFSLAGHAGAVNDVAFSPESRLLATGGFGGVVKVWDLATGNERYTLPSQVNTVETIRFTPDGKRMITGGNALVDPGRVPSIPARIGLPGSKLTRRRPGLRTPILHPGHDLDHGGRLGLQGLPKGAGYLVGLFHAGGPAAHLLGDAGKATATEAIKLLRIAGPIFIDAFDVGNSLGKAAVVVDDGDRVDVVAARCFQLAEVVPEAAVAVETDDRALGCGTFHAQRSRVSPA